MVKYEVRGERVGGTLLRSIDDGATCAWLYAGALIPLVVDRRRACNFEPRG